MNKQNNICGQRFANISKWLWSEERNAHVSLKFPFNLHLSMWEKGNNFLNICYYFFFTIPSLSGQELFEIFFIILVIVLYFMLWLSPWLHRRLCGSASVAPTSSTAPARLHFTQITPGEMGGRLLGRSHSPEDHSGVHSILEGLPWSRCHLKTIAQFKKQKRCHF